MKKKLRLIGLAYEPSKIEADGRDWLELEFEGCELCFSHVLTKDTDNKCWILTYYLPDRTVNCVVQEKLVKWTNMPIKPQEQKQKPVPMEIVGKPPVKVEIKKSDEK